jgi:hypothetical protein
MPPVLFLKKPVFPRYENKRCCPKKTKKMAAILLLAASGMTYNKANF